jgi:hypothetical protein
MIDSDASIMITEQKTQEKYLEKSFDILNKL